MPRASTAKTTAGSPPSPPPVRVLLGSDALLRREAIARHKAEWLAGSSEAESFDLSEVSLGRVLEAASCQSMFAPKQVVVAHNLPAVPAAEHGALIAYLKRPAPGTLLLLLADKLDARLQLTRALSASGCNQPLRPPAKPQLPSWLQERAKLLGAALLPAAAALLADRVGDDLGLLEQSLHKLSAFVGPQRPITREDVLLLVAATREASIFALTDAVASGPWPKASAELARLLADGEQPLVILAMLVRQVRLLLAAQHGTPPGLPPYVAQALVRRAKHLPRRALRAALADLQRCDGALKQSYLPPAMVLERAIWPLASAAQPQLTGKPYR